MKEDGELGFWTIKTDLIVSLLHAVLFLKEYPINVAFLKQLEDELEGLLIELSQLFLSLFLLAYHYLRKAWI